MTVRRDYKPRPKPGRRNLRLTALAAVALMLVIGFAVALSMLAQRPADPAASRPAANPPPPVAARQEPPAPAPVTESRYDFYSLLREREVRIPEGEIVPRDARPTPATAPRHLVQVGAYAEAAHAERAKAQLAMLGVVSKIDTARDANGTTQYRVRVGPFAELAQAENLREQLRAHKIEAITLRGD